MTVPPNARAERSPAARAARTEALVKHWRDRGMSATGVRRALGLRPGALALDSETIDFSHHAAHLPPNAEGTTHAERSAWPGNGQVKNGPNEPAPSKDHAPSVDDVIAAVAMAAGISGAELVGEPGGRDRRDIAHVRQLAMALARELTGAYLKQVAEAFGRDPTTVLYAERQVTVRRRRPAGQGRLKEIEDLARRTLRGSCTPNAQGDDGGARSGDGAVR